MARKHAGERNIAANRRLTEVFQVIAVMQKSRGSKRRLGTKHRSEDSDFVALSRRLQAKPRLNCVGLAGTFVHSQRGSVPSSGSCTDGPGAFLPGFDGATLVSITPCREYRRSRQQSADFDTRNDVS